MNSIKYILIFFSFLAYFVHAQEITDYDLQNFARAYKEMVKLNNKAQEEMAKEIKEVDLDLEIYHAINDSKGTDMVPDVPQSNFKKFDKVQPNIEKIQEKLEKDVEKAFANNDLTKTNYKAIAERIKQDYILQTKLEQIMAKIGRN